MARSMFSRGMLLALASAMMVRKRGFMSGSPPPARAATVNSLMSRVKILPRLASAAPFLCLMEAHLEWPDMSELPEKCWKTSEILHPFREDDPHVGARVPRPAAVVADHRVHREPRAFELPRHLRHGERAEGEGETVLAPLAAAAFDVALLERGEPALAILRHRLDESQMRGAVATAQLHAVTVLAPVRQVRHEIDPEDSAGRDHTRDRRERRGQIVRANQRLQDAVRRDDHRK